MTNKPMGDKLALHRLCLEIVQAVWKRIEWDKVSPSRRMKIYEELNSKIKSAATTSKIEKFVENLCKKFDVRDIGSLRVIQIVENVDEKKLLKVLREDTQIIILLLKEAQLIAKEERAVMTPPADFMKPEAEEKEADLFE